jgi:hypothetical protein
MMRQRQHFSEAFLDRLIRKLGNVPFVNREALYLNRDRQKRQISLKDYSKIIRKRGYRVEAGTLHSFVTRAAGLRPTYRPQDRTVFQLVCFSAYLRKQARLKKKKRR